MNSKIKGTASVKVIIITFMDESKWIPKYIELFDKSLKAIRSKWYESNTFSIDSLEAGTYTLRLSLSSGVQKDETFDLQDAQTKEIEINIGDNSPHESHEWAYFSKSFTIQSLRGTNMKSIDYYKVPGKMVNGKLWNCNEGSWQQQTLPEFMNQTIHGDGNIYSLSTAHQLSLLEISGDDMPNLYVSLPPGNQLKCLVKLSECKNEEVHPIDVTVSTDYFKAETLLTLLTNGAIREAKTLSNAAEAEELLYHKMKNPVTASIGGYFLLKIGDLERLHHWADNLANWFSWLPDGAIIHATQLLNKAKKTDIDIELIRKRLLDATNAGIPVYSEGLRLLEKGLTQLWYHFGQKDSEINKAYKRIGNYLEVADLSQETTTFIGISPSEPGRVHNNKFKEIDPIDILQS